MSIWCLQGLLLLCSKQSSLMTHFEINLQNLTFCKVLLVQMCKYSKSLTESNAMPQTGKGHMLKVNKRDKK